MRLSPISLVDPIIDRAFAEDLSGSDVTTHACIPEETVAVARAVARKPVVVSGVDVAARVFEKLDTKLTFERHVEDGTLVPAMTALFTVRGSAQSILMAERTALNLIQRMIGTATLTRAYVDAVPKGRACRITDTRKTTPGLRLLERYAVRCGGGKNHRDDLGSAILIKDNHIVASGGVKEAIGRARANASHTCTIECEVDKLAQLELALEAGVDIVLLDNMDDATVAKALARVREVSPRTLVEASGGITLARITALAELGVDAISVGALTHSAPAADIGLDFDPA